MYKVKRVRKFDFKSTNAVANILYLCGKDMARKYGLRHWDNPYFKSLLIVLYCALKNEVYVVYKESEPVGTFQLRKKEDTLYFEKLATLPSKSGKGVGSFCLSVIEEFAAQKGCNRVTMDVYQSSEHAIRFYKNKGYQITGTTESMSYVEFKMEKRI